MSCSVPSCRRNERNDNDDDHGGDPGRRESAEQECKGRTHNLSIFDPPPSRFTLLRGKILKSIKTLYTYWLRFRNDRYQWALFKTILWFAIGLKLFHDLARHAKVSLLLGGGSKCPAINESRRKHDPCAKPPKDPCAKPPQIDPCANPKDPCPKPKDLCAKPMDPFPKPEDPCAKPKDPCAKPPEIDPCAKPPQIDPCDDSTCPHNDESPQTPQSEEDKKIAERCRRWYN